MSAKEHIKYLENKITDLEKRVEILSTENKNLKLKLTQIHIPTLDELHGNWLSSLQQTSD